nr:MAG TPA_asm: putative tail fiber protein [Caudoviricetes sp.]
MNINQAVEGIRKALYGREVREYIAYSIEWVYSFTTAAVDKVVALEASASTSAAAAKESETNAANSADSAAASSSAAADSARSAKNSESSLNEAVASAARSENGAAQSARDAKNSADRAAAIVSTDTNLDIKGAPADAKAVGDELAKRLLKEGGTMTGPINFGTETESIYSSGNDAANGPGGELNNLVISSWYGVSFTTSQEDSPNKGKTTIGIDCRTGLIKAEEFSGKLTDENGDHPIWFDLNNGRLSPENEYWLCAHTNDYGEGFEIRDINIGDLKNAIVDSAKEAVVVSSGSNYVRFSDGTQICWGGDVWVTCGSDPGTFSFPQAFASSNYGITFINCTHSGNEKIVRYANRYTTYCEVSCSGGGTVDLSYIAVGRWK